MSADQAIPGNKLHSKYENPLDIGCLRLAEYVAPWFRQHGATPNMITTLSVIASGLAIWNVYSGGSKLVFVVCAALAYLFDCLDGHFARRYDMCTTFGDYYDHLSDWAYFIGLFYVAFVIRGLKTNMRPYKMMIYGAIVFTLIASVIHVGFQEIIYQTKTRNESPTLDIFSQLSNKLCAIPESCIKASRWFGLGTFVAVSTALIVITVR
jgi:phosphatidylglycerophosphate synthase